jgi:hypothetical protein
MVGQQPFDPRCEFAFPLALMSEPKPDITVLFTDNQMPGSMMA